MMALRTFFSLMNWVVSATHIACSALAASELRFCPNVGCGLISVPRRVGPGFGQSLHGVAQVIAYISTLSTSP